MIRAHEFLLVGLEITTTPARMTADTMELSNCAEALGLIEAIPHAVSRRCYVSLVWDWSVKRDFNLMVALEVTTIEGLPDGVTSRRFTPCDFAVFAMQGEMPNLVEP